MSFFVALYFTIYHKINKKTDIKKSIAIHIKIVNMTIIAIFIIFLFMLIFIIFLNLVLTFSILSVIV